MDSRREVFIFVVIASSLLLHFPSQAEAELPIGLLSEVCKKADDFNCCLEVLKSCPEASLATSKKSIAEVALKLAMKETTNIRDFFNDLSNKSPTFTAALKMCADSFNSSVSLFTPTVLEGDTASLDVHYALDNCQSCETNLNDNKVHLESVAGRIREWRTFYTAAYASVIALEN